MRMRKVIFILSIFSIAIADICKQNSFQLNIWLDYTCQDISYLKYVSENEIIFYNPRKGILNLYNQDNSNQIQYQEAIPSANMIEVVDQERKLVLIVKSDSTMQIIDMINNGIYIDLGVKNDIHLIPIKRDIQVNDLIYISKQSDNKYIFNEVILDNSSDVTQENELITYITDSGTFSYCIKSDNLIYALINESSLNYLLVFKNINNIYQLQNKLQIKSLVVPNEIQVLNQEKYLLISDLVNQMSVFLDLNTYEVVRKIRFSYFSMSNSKFLFFWQFKSLLNKNPSISKVSLVTVDKSNWQTVSNLDVFNVLISSFQTQLQRILQTPDQVALNEVSVAYSECQYSMTLYKTDFNYKPRFQGLLYPIDLMPSQESSIKINFSNSLKLLAFSQTEIFLIDTVKRQLTNYFQLPSYNFTYITQIDDLTIAAGNQDGKIIIFKLQDKDGTNQKSIEPQSIISFHSSPIVQIEIDTKRQTIYTFSSIGHYITCHIKNGKQVAIQSLSQLNIDSLNAIKYISNYDQVFILGTQKGLAQLMFYDVSLSKQLNSINQFKQSTYILKLYQFTTCYEEPCLLIAFQVSYDALVQQVLLTNNPSLGLSVSIKSFFYSSTDAINTLFNLFDNNQFLIQRNSQFQNQYNFIYSFNSKSSGFLRYGPLDSTTQSINLNDNISSVAMLSDQYPNQLFIMIYFGKVKSYGGCDDKYQTSLSTFLNIDFSYFNFLPIDCSSQVSNCQNCFLNIVTQKPQCVQCTQGLALYTDEKGQQQCLQDCGVGYYIDYHTMWCQQCSSSCQECSKISSNCSVCKNNLYVFNGTCVSFCSEGYYLDQNTCKQCDSSCLFCEKESSNCTQCATGFYLNNLNPMKGECIKCDILCQSCSESPINCNKCIQGVYLRKQNQCSIQPCPDGQYPDVSTGSCQQCDQNCYQCQEDSTTCISCHQGSYLFQNKCYTKCLIGTYQSEALSQCITCDEKNCINCSSSNQKCSEKASCKENQFFNIFSQKCEECSLPCQTCNHSDSECESCISSFVFVKDQMTCNLKCPSRYYLEESSNICYQCPEGCQECSSKYNCSSCIQNDSVVYIQFGLQCLSQCPTSYFKNNFQCLPCYSTCLNCSDQSSLSCTECGQNLFLYKGQCLKECPNEFVKDYLSQKCVLCDPTSSSSEFTCSNMINFRVIQNNYFTNRFILLFNQPISTKSANLADYVVFQFRNIDPLYYKYDLLQNDPQAVEIKFQIDYNILQTILFNQVYQIRVVNSTFLRGTYSNSSVFQNYKYSSSIGVILSNDLNSKLINHQYQIYLCFQQLKSFQIGNIEEFQERISILIYFSLGFIAVFMLIFSQVKIVIESIVQLQYLVLALLYISPQSPFMSQLVRELFKFNFYGISHLIVEQSNILGSQLNKFYETGDTKIFGTEISSNEFSPENNFLTSNYVANILRIIEWIAILLVAFVLIEVITTIISLDLLRSSENVFLKLNNTFQKICFIPILFYSFFQLKYYDDSQFINVVSYFASLIVVVYNGIVCFKNVIITDKIVKNIIENFDNLKIYLATILVVFFINQRKEMLGILFCLDLLDIIISIGKTKDSKEIQVLMNSFSMIIYALAISNYFFQDQNQNYTSVVDAQIIFIYIIFGFLYLLNIIVLVVFIKAYHKKEKALLISLYYADSQNLKQKEIKQVQQIAKSDEDKDNQIKLSFPTTQMLHTSNGLNANISDKKRIDILEDKISQLQKYLEQRKQSTFNGNTEFTPILNENQALDDSPQIKLKKRQESIDQVIQFSSSNDHDYNFSQDDVKKK